MGGTRTKRNKPGHRSNQIHGVISLSRGCYPVFLCSRSMSTQLNYAEPNNGYAGILDYVASLWFPAPGNPVYSAPLFCRFPGFCRRFTRVIGFTIEHAGEHRGTGFILLLPAIPFRFSVSVASSCSPTHAGNERGVRGVDHSGVVVAANLRNSALRNSEWRAQTVRPGQCRL